jgi:hypothetical protein
MFSLRRAALRTGFYLPRDDRAYCTDGSIDGLERVKPPRTPLEPGQASSPAAATQERLTAPPVFVGGSGSSGTTVTARLLGQHSQFAFVPIELNFHADPAGLPGLITGRTTRLQFLEWIRGRFRYEHHSSRPRGLHFVIDEESFEAALAAFDEAFASDPLEAGRQMVRTFCDPVALAAGKPSWVEMTPRNAVAATSLLTLFPDAKVIHSVHDGRDVATDKVRRGMKVPDVYAALDWWANKLVRADRQAKQVGDRMLVIRMADLVRNAREETYQRVLDFLGIDDDPGMREYFEQTVSPDKARIGSWSTLVPDGEEERFDARYQEVLAKLEASGVSCLPPPESALEPESAPAAERLQIDPKKINLLSPRLAAGATASDAPDDRLFADLAVNEQVRQQFGDDLAAAQTAYEAGGEAEDVRVEIRCDGRFRLVGGERRLSLARLLGLEAIPALVVSREHGWMEFRATIDKYRESRRGRVYQLIDHPDLINLPAYHGSARFEILRDALEGHDAAGKRLLDIGTHWGYMPQQMERLGFVCTGVEHNGTCIQIAEDIRVATEGNYTIWGGSIFDFPHAEDQNVILALNVFNHFIKTEALHAKLVGFLNRLSADIILFEPHVADQPGKMPPGVYRNYQPEEFTEFVAEQAGMSEYTYLGHEPDHYSQWKRPIYKITR